MLKFENVDVIATLGAIMRQNTEFYRSDFDIDKEIIEQAAVSDDDEDKYLLWMSRPAGTYCFRERETYIQGTRQHNTWKYYGEQTHDRILAYAVELNASRGGKVHGTIYALDYLPHFQHIKAAALPSSTNRLTYQRGIRDIPPDAPFDGYPDYELGPLLRYDILPKDPAALDALLAQERHRRAREAIQGDFRAYHAALAIEHREAVPQLALAGW